MRAAERPGSVTRWLVVAAGLDVLGGRVAERHGLVGEPLHIGPPRFVPPPLTTVVWGTALSGRVMYRPSSISDSVLIFETVPWLLFAIQM